MSWGSMFRLHRDTIRVVQLCFNVIVRAAAVALCWAGLLGIGFALNWFINIVLESLNASGAFTGITSQAILAFVVVLAVAATITSFSDVIALAWASIRAAIGKSSDSNTEGGPDADQKSAPD